MLENESAGKAKSTSNIDYGMSTKARYISAGVVLAIIAALVLAITNPFRGPLERDDASLKSAFTSQELNSSAKSFCSALTKVLVTASDPQESRLPLLKQASEGSQIAAKTFIEKNSWMQDSSAKSQLEISYSHVSTAQLEKAIKDKYPALSKSWSNYQVSRLNEEFSTYAVSRCPDVSLIYDVSLAVLEKYDTARDKVRALAQSESPGKSQPQTVCQKINAQINEAKEALSGATSVTSAMDQLSHASQVWSQAAASFSGSKHDWLNKMAELSGAVNSYLQTGEPDDGPLKATQLQNNMKLFPIFCK